MPSENNCRHSSFEAYVDVNRIVKDGTDDIERLAIEVKVRCQFCQEPVRFLGLPAGVDLNSPTVSADATEARLIALPKSQVLSELEGTPHGFTIRKDQS